MSYPMLTLTTYLPEPSNHNYYIFNHSTTPTKLLAAHWPCGGVAAASEGESGSTAALTSLFRSHPGTVVGLKTASVLGSLHECTNKGPQVFVARGFLHPARVNVDFNFLNFVNSHITTVNVMLQKTRKAVMFR
jgi:hypothetical protein